VCLGEEGEGDCRLRECPRNARTWLWMERGRLLSLPDGLAGELLQRRNDAAQLLNGLAGGLADLGVVHQVGPGTDGGQQSLRLDDHVVEQFFHGVLLGLGPAVSGGPLAGCLGLASGS
jgi:hypothetical protein